MAIKSALNNKATLEIGEVFDLVRTDLERVEEELTRESQSGTEPVAAIARYLQSGGGKRLRPALHLLAARFCGYQGPSSVRLGAVLELLHAATLMHDDVIDQADTRRGRPSTNQRWGNPMTVLAGDWLYMQSFKIALAERNLRILDVLIGLTQRMVEGELLQLTRLRRADISEEEALDLSRRKTAELFAVSMELGSLLGRQPPPETQKLARYGLNLGMAFQIIDDLLDFVADPARLGKPVVNDLREGKVTLPLVYALAAAGEAGRKKVEAVLEERGFSSVQPEEIIALVRETGAVQRTRARAGQFVEEAYRCLEAFPDSTYKRALEAVPQFVLHRDY
ncbi:MAG: polyprenyl synthetase family protein [Candidatus Acidoferrales bacterium]